MNKDLSNEALIALALGAKENEAVSTTKQEELVQLVELFIEANCIKSGSVKIRSYQIIDLFRRWTKTKVTNKTMMTVFNKYFHYDTAKNYHLDPKPFDTSKDFMFKQYAKTRNARLRRKIDRELAEKKAKQEKQSEISGPNPQCQPEDEMGTD